MAKYDIDFYLNGVPSPPPKNWMDIEIKASYENDLQPVVEVDSFTFVNENAKTIYEWINRYGAFQGLPFTMNIFANNIGNLVYDGCLDFTDQFEAISPVEVRCKIKPDEGLDLFFNRIEAISYGYLASLKSGVQGAISNSDYVNVPIVIRKKFDGFETAFAGVAIYLMQKEIRNSISEISKDQIKNIKLALSAPLQKPAEFFEALATVIIFIAYKVAMLIAIIRMIKTVLNNLLPTPTNYKGMYLRTALERALDYFDIELDCDIPEIDYYVYLPSKTDNKIRKNRKDEGIPNTSDYGYQVSEMLDLVYKLFRAKPIKKRKSSTNNKEVLVIRAVKSEDLRRQTNYTLPDVLTESYSLNAQDFAANFIMSFEYDITDEYTMPNARDTPFDSKKADEEKNRYERGVSYEVITDVQDVLDPRYKLNKGLEEVRIPLALGTRRNTLTVFEQTAKVLLVAVDLVIKLFGGKTFAEKINDGKGRLIISQNSFNIAKLVVLQNGLIPKNHRDLLSARYLYENYHYWRSFVSNANNSQKKVFNNITIPFGFSDFVLTQRASTFTTSSGGKGEFTDLKWRLSADTAIANYTINHKYSTNLFETFIEP